MIRYHHVLLLALATVWSATLTDSIWTDFIDKLIFPKKCIKDLGCFNTGPPFYHPTLRPISLVPWDLKNINTKFYLYTAPGKRTLLKPTQESLEKSGYNKDLRLYVFIHGFKMDWNKENLDLIEKFINSLLAVEKSNVILLDWTDSNKDNYPQAVSNGRVVGAQTAQLIKFLQQNTGLLSENIHLIGHSLGAHVSGWVGERIPNISRISGLDPAGPYFRQSAEENAKNLRPLRLDTTDAKFVDIIHSHAADFVLQGLGIKEATGHQDFYPNGGSQQPGCAPSAISISMVGMDIIVNGSDGLIATLGILCNHVRAIDYFMESIDNSDCKFIGTQCKSYDEYDKGKCNSNKKVEMGFHATPDSTIRPGSKLYLKTSDKTPFCIK